MIAEVVSLSYRSKTEMQSAEMLKIMLISNCLPCLISEINIKPEIFKSYLDSF